MVNQRMMVRNAQYFVSKGKDKDFHHSYTELNSTFQQLASSSSIEQPSLDKRNLNGATTPQLDSIAQVEILDTNYD